MSSLRRATVGEVLKAIRTRIITACRLPANSVFVAAVEPASTLKVSAERLVVLRPTNESPDSGIDGGGRYVNRRRRTVDVVLHTRMWVDESHMDSERLLHASLGHFAFEDTIVNVLEDWLPLAADGDAIAEPVACLGWLSPSKANGDPGWASSRLEIAFVYERNLTLPEVS